MKNLYIRTKNGSSLRRSQSGISMTETLIVLPVLVVFVLAIVQFGLIYRTKITLEYAAHEAARAGALNNGLPLPFVLRVGNSTGPSAKTVGSVALASVSDILTRGSVWQGMVNAMMPLYVNDTTPAGLFRGWAKTNKDLIQSSCIEYLNPTQQTFVDWAFIENFGENRWIFQIPNDTLRYRKPLEYDYAAKKLSVINANPVTQPVPAIEGLRGRVSNKTIAEANVLHLRLHYGYKLNIPIVNKVMLSGYELARGSNLNQLEKHLISEGRLPLQAEGTVGMQSPLYWHPFYSFGPARDRTLKLQFDTAWNVSEPNVLEAPGDVITSIIGFIRNGAGNAGSSSLAAGIDKLAQSVGSGFTFCPAIWDEGILKAMDKVPNGASPGSAAP